MENNEILQETEQQTVEQPVEQTAYPQPEAQPVKKKRLGLIIGVVAAVAVLAVVAVLFLFTGGPSINELVAGNRYETYVKGETGWVCVTLSFDELGENYIIDRCLYTDNETSGELSRTSATIACAFEETEDGVYVTDDYKVTVSEDQIVSFVQMLTSSEVEYTQVEESQVNEYLENQAIEIFSNYRVYSYSNKTYGDVIPLVVDDYRLVCTPVSDTQYRITVTGAYYPNKAEMDYVQDGGKYTCLVDIETKEGKIEENVGIGDAMRLYVVLTTW